MKEKIFVLGVGCQKGGTSWLHKQFERSPYIDLGFTKEYHVFDALYIKSCRSYLSKRINKLEKLIDSGKLIASQSNLLKLIDFHQNTRNYFDYFDYLYLKSEKVKVVGDLTPSYCGLPSSAFDLIKSQAEAMGFQVKVIFIMRDPFERIWSAIRMMRGNRASKNPDYILNKEKDEEIELLNSYKNVKFRLRTRYQDTITNIESIFDAENVFYGFYENLFTETSIKNFEDFLGIDLSVNFEEKINVSPKSIVSISSENIEKVVKFYEETYSFCDKKFISENLSKIWFGYKYL